MNAIMNIKIKKFTKLTGTFIINLGMFNCLG